MEARINGEIFKFEKEITLSEYVELKKMNDRPFVIEKNSIIIPKTDYEKVYINDNDNIEIASFCAGG